MWLPFWQSILSNSSQHGDCPKILSHCSRAAAADAQTSLPCAASHTLRYFHLQDFSCLSICVFLVTESHFLLFVVLFEISSYFFPFAHLRLASHNKIAVFPEWIECDIMFTVKQCSIIYTTKTEPQRLCFSSLADILLQAWRAAQDVVLRSSTQDKVVEVTGSSQNVEKL